MVMKSMDVDYDSTICIDHKTLSWKRIAIYIAHTIHHEICCAENCNLVWLILFITNPCRCCNHWVAAIFLGGIKDVC